MGQTVTFTVSSHGYDFAGGTVDLTVVEGGSATITIDRLHPAERLYRVTGAGIYADSVRLGLSTPLAEPLINGLVMG
jgi:hypothetical protein